MALSKDDMLCLDDVEDERDGNLTSGMSSGVKMEGEMEDFFDDDFVMTGKICWQGSACYSYDLAAFLERVGSRGRSV